MEIVISKEARRELRRQFANKSIRIHPKMKTWSLITYKLVQDEQRDDDSVYNYDYLKFLINKKLEKEISYIEIDFAKEWWGEDYIVTTGV